MLFSGTTPLRNESSASKARTVFSQDRGQQKAAAVLNLSVYQSWSAQTS